MEYIYKSSDLDKTILVVPGRLDAITYLELENILLELFADKGRGLAIDFRHVDYVSSAGLRALMRGLKQMQARGGALSLFNLSSEVFRVFSVSGLDKVFNIVNTETDALLSIKHQLKPAGRN